MRAWIAPSFAAATAFAFLFSCSKDGDDAASPPPAPEPAVAGVVDTGEKVVSGTVTVADAAAVGYELLTLNHTNDTFRRDPIGRTGAFSIPVAHFIADNIYTMHLARDFVVVADIDMSSSLPGAQLPFSYQGGTGYALGAIAVPLDLRGAPGRVNGTAQGKLGGGFGLAAGNTSEFSSFPTPFLASVVAAGSQLIVLDAATILHAFYRKAANPKLYAEELAAHSRVGFRIASEYENRFTRGSVLEAGDWMRSARIAGDADDPHGGAALWAQSNFSLAPRVDRKELLASVFSGAVLDPDTFIILEMAPADGRAEIQVPRRIGTAIGMPPKVTAVALDGGTPADLDYADETAANGLTRPFCRTGDLGLTLEPPKDLDLAAFPDGIFDTIDVALDYYGVADGLPRRLPASLADLPAEFAAIFAAESGTDSTIAWDPVLQEFRVTLGAVDVVAPSQTLTIPAAIFVRAVTTAVGPAGVFYMRVRITFRDSHGAAAGGIAVWLDASC